MLKKEKKRKKKGSTDIKNDGIDLKSKQKSVKRISNDQAKIALQYYSFDLQNLKQLTDFCDDFNLSGLNLDFLH